MVSPPEFFRPAFNPPMMPGEAQQDFESKDADGKFFAPEASLKSLVFINTTSNHAAMATGAKRVGAERHVHGVSGMAGAGKTMALIGLGHDEDIRTHFIDGVLYMSIGATATVERVTGQLNKIMRVTGATESASNVLSSTSLADAVTQAAIWFQGKRILFILDDIWPTSDCPKGYLPDLEGLLCGNSESRIAVSTRSLLTSAHGGSRVDFGARDPRGPISTAMFMAHAAMDMDPSESRVETAQGILELCSGLPIALDVAGSTVSMYMKMGLKYESACQIYLDEISTVMEKYPAALFLDSAIRLSLAALEADFEKSGSPDAADDSASELYTSLCGMENQQIIPLPVLARVGNMSEAKTEAICLLFTSMSLAKIGTQALDGREQCGLCIHDLHLEYCHRRAIQSREEKAWHRRLLNGHWTSDVTDNAKNSFDDVNDLRGFNILEYTPRPWRKEDVPNRGYIQKNLSRHLRGASLGLELGATILDLRWVSAQGIAGGVLGLKNDFSILPVAVEESAGTKEPLEPVTVLSNIIVANAGSLQNGIRVLIQILYAYLAVLSKANEWIHRYMEQMKDVTPRPFLVSKRAFYRHPMDDLKWTIELKLPSQDNFAYLSTDCSPYSRYCASGADHDVVVYNLENKSRLQWLKGHENHVSVVKFNSDSSKLVSGSLDGCVMVWNWKETELPLLVLKGHKGKVTSLSLSDDNCRLFSGSFDGTVRIWDLITGHLLREINYGTEVECISSCAQQMS